MGTSLLCAKQAPPGDGGYGCTMPVPCMQREKGPGTWGEATRLLHSRVVLSHPSLFFLTLFRAMEQSVLAI